jgi:hypothetical protein
MAVEAGGLWQRPAHYLASSAVDRKATDDLSIPFPELLPKLLSQPGHRRDFAVLENDR